MIDPIEARRRIARHVRPLASARVPVGRALGCVLAEDVVARRPVPAFDNSAMDGFALRTRETDGATPACPVSLRVVGDVFAGSATRRRLGAGEAYRIMTGAPLPPGADTVIPKEDVRMDGDRLIVQAPLSRGRHVRRAGEGVSSGERVATAGEVVQPGVVAAIAAVGRATVRVVRRPTVAIVVTGDETVEPGRRLGRGQIYDSNSYMLRALLARIGIAVARCRHVGDRRSTLRRALGAALSAADVLLVSGGVSVGDRDFVRPALEDLGVDEVFWRVRQKPGKPLYFGARGRRVVFGLPGNPVSAFTCFYAYVYPALRRLMGEDRGLPERLAPVEGDVNPDAVKWMFLRGRSRGDAAGTVRVGRRQGSHMVSSLAGVDRIVVVPPLSSRGTPERWLTWVLPDGVV